MVKWYTTGLRQLLEEMTQKFNALSVETRIELLRIAPDITIVMSRVVRYYEATKGLYDKKEVKHGRT